MIPLYNRCEFFAIFLTIFFEKNLHYIFNRNNDRFLFIIHSQI
nr:MAG TPA: hypothetical protein [Caudoviricetes sp.]